MHITVFISTHNIFQDKHIYILIFERLTICPKYVTILSNSDIFLSYGSNGMAQSLSSQIER